MSLDDGRLLKGRAFLLCLAQFLQKMEMFAFQTALHASSLTALEQLHDRLAGITVLISIRNFRIGSVDF